MRTKNLSWLLPGAAILCLSCAPGQDHVPDPEPKDTKITDIVPIDIKASNGMEALRGRVEAAIAHVKQRDLLIDNSFWTIFHGILGMGLETTLKDPGTGKQVNAIEYIRKGGPVRGMKFIRTEDGLDVQIGPQFEGQGHQDQFVAEMVQWGLPPDAEFTVDGRKHVFADFFRFSRLRASVTKNQELSWAVIIVGQQYGLDHEWTNTFGEKIRMADVLKYEAEQPIDNAACGGTHRLFGMTWVYNMHLRRGGHVTGVWKQVADRLAEQKARAKKHQNPDGSFSTKYLDGPEHSKDAEKRIGTTGHVLEWLSLYLSDAELREPWMQEAANALALMILQNQRRGIESGALYHATHGMNIYHARVFGGKGQSHIPLPP